MGSRLLITALVNFSWLAGTAHVFAISSMGLEDSAETKTTAAKLTLPSPRLAPLTEGRSDESELALLAEEINNTIRNAEQNSEVGNRGEYLLAAANLILARQVEPSCSRLVLGLENIYESGQAATDVSFALDRADRLLNDAGNFFGDRPAGNPADEDSRRTTDERLKVLRAFANSLRVALSPNFDAEGLRRLRETSSLLSPLLEDDHAKISAAAQLWCGVLRSFEGEGERALAVLDWALSEPKSDAQPFAFFAKLLRCRLVADRGGYATSLALLFQMEERCDAWFRTESERANAWRAVSLVETQVLRDWHNSLDPQSHEQERDWCVRRIDAIREERFGEADADVMRLTTSIPIIVPVPGSLDAGQSPPNSAPVYGPQPEGAQK